MIETTRERILANLKNELMNIQIANGYSFDLAEVRVGLFSNTSITNYPTAIIQFGDDNLVTQTEGLILGENQIDLGVIVYLNTNTENLADETEKIIKDLQKFFSRDESIAREFTSSLSELEYIMNYKIMTISPYISGTNNSTACGLVLRIDYFNKIDSEALPTPDVPMLESPTNNYESGIIKQPFDWSEAENALSYQLQVSEDNFETLIINQDKLLTPSYTTPHDIDLADGTTYNWRVRSNGANEKSNWSDTWSFIVNDTSIVAKTPLEVSSNTLWLRSDTGVTLTGAKVTAWNDQSPSAFHLSNSTDANRPTLVTNYYGSKPAIYFNHSVASTITCLGRADTTGLFKMDGTQTKTIMMSLMQDSSGLLLNVLMGRGNTSNGMQWRMVKQAFNAIGFNIDNYTFPKGTTATDEIALPVVYNSQPMQVIILCNLLNIKIYLNTVLVADKTVSYNAGIPDNSGTFLSLGSSYFNNTAQGAGKMHLFEYAFWNKVLSTSEITSLYKYHQEYYGV